MAKKKPERNGHEPELVIDLDALKEQRIGLRVSATEAYAYRPWDGFTIMERRSIARDWDELGTMEKAEELKEGDDKRYSDLAWSVLRRICEIPEDLSLTEHEVVRACSAYFFAQDQRAMTMPIELARMAGRLDNLITELSRSLSKAAGPAQEEPKNG